MLHTRVRHVGAVAAAAASILALASCGAQVHGVGTFASQQGQVADAKVDINGLDNGKPSDVDRIAGNAITDIQTFWTEQFPQAFDGKRYSGPKGGFYSVDPSDSGATVPCVDSPSEIRGNAFYCPSRDIVAWDRVGLFPQLKKNFGDFLIAMVLAHEWGHVIQTKSRVDPSRTIVRETQADCYAGAFTRWALSGQAPHFPIQRAELDNSLAGYLLFRDPVGAGADDEQAHGNGFDRISGFQEGFEEGVAHCKTFTDERQFTEIRFTRQDDADRGGNLPFDGAGGALTVGQQDLDQTWPQLFRQSFGKQLNKPKLAVAESGDSVDCGGPQKKGVLFCAQDNSLKLSHDPLENVYNRVDHGDYAPMTLVGIGYGQAVVAQAGMPAGDDATKLRQAICLDGAYTRSVVNRPASSQQVTLSPGDLDEAMQALLFYAGQDTFFGSPDQMSGFDRVQAYRRGFTDIKQCSSLS
jgi:predicted metalloprotease